MAKKKKGGKKPAAVVPKVATAEPPTPLTVPTEVVQVKGGKMPAAVEQTSATSEPPVISTEEVLRILFSQFAFATIKSVKIVRWKRS
jgi:hypothetical protein